MDDQGESFLWQSITGALPQAAPRGGDDRWGAPGRHGRVILAAGERAGIGAFCKGAGWAFKKPSH